MSDNECNHVNLKVDVSMIGDDFQCESMINEIKNVMNKYNYKEVVRTVDESDTVKNNYVEFADV